jgi:hypothetical protein
MAALLVHDGDVGEGAPLERAAKSAEAPEGNQRDVCDISARAPRETAVTATAIEKTSAAVAINTTNSRVRRAYLRLVTNTSGGVPVIGVELRESKAGAFCFDVYSCGGYRRVFGPSGAKCLNR